MQLKYIRIDSGFIVWPDTMWDIHHKHMAALVNEKIISAGFCIFQDEAFHCYGMSESLKISSKGVEDSVAINKFFGISSTF